MAAVGETTEEQIGAVQANRQLRRAVDRCLSGGVPPARVAQALVRMAEAVASEVAEDEAGYQAIAEGQQDVAAFAKECRCGHLYSDEHCFCSRCGASLATSVVPKVIPGRLQFEKRVGKGGSGVIYEAIDLSLGRRVAVKTIPGVVSQYGIARLRREAQALAAVSHRHLATVHGFEVFLGTPMIIMQYVDGGTLSDKIPLPLDVAIEVMLEIVEAVQCMHTAGILHRDIKPRNIGFTRQGELKLLDFGLARLENEATISGVPGQSVVGTPAYLSPEALARAKADPQFDIWALGVVFYEMLTGCRPFEAGSRSNLVAAIQNGRSHPIHDRLPGCSRALRRFFESAFHRAVPRRPGSTQEFVKMLWNLRTLSPVA